MLTLSNNSNDDVTQTQWLDLALKGHSPETKNKVLDFVVRFGIEPQDKDFWRIFVAFGYLHTLIVTSPDRWQALFDGFQKDLEAWAQNTQCSPGDTDRKAILAQLQAIAHELKQQKLQLESLRVSIEETRRQLGRLKHTRNYYPPENNRRLTSLLFLTCMGVGVIAVYLVLR